MPQSRSMLKTVFTLLWILPQFPFFLLSQDWPQWRGPNRDGAIPAFEEPAVWPAQLTRKWQVDVGIGHSSPLLVKKSVYLHTRQGEEEVVSRLDLDTGRRIWRDSYPAPYTMNRAAVPHGKGPKSTPLFHSGKLFTFGISGILSCYDAEGGKLRWRRDFASDFQQTSPRFGTATSPMIEGGLLIVHAGGHDSGALSAIDTESGKAVWSWNGDGPAYASPVVLDAAGTRQIVTQSQNNIVGVSAADGKLLWSIPFTTAYVQNVITPVLYQGTVILSGLNKGVMAVRLEENEGKWRADKVWENEEVSFYMSTPVLSGDLLLGLSHKGKGQFAALDARTGKTLWTTTGREGENAAVLTAGDKVFLLTDGAELIVAKAGAGRFEALRRYTVATSPTWAHPVISGSNILVKDIETLALWRLE